jgi:hypothetical protein
MSQLIVDVLRVAFGVGIDFSFIAWAYVSAILLLVGPLFAQIAPRVIEPPARVLASEPRVVAWWLPLSWLATFGVVLFLAITIVGIPAAMLVPLIVIVLALGGYVALARLTGERLAVQLGAKTVPPVWLATLIGITLFRLIRLVPFVGAAAHSLIAWISYAAVCLVLYRAARSWHARRMPDAQQFAGETLIEWYPEGDPVDGPRVGTGRPVIGNIRGDEDRGSSRDIAPLTGDPDDASESSKGSDASR